MNMHVLLVCRAHRFNELDLSGVAIAKPVEVDPMRDIMAKVGVLFSRVLRSWSKQIMPSPIHFSARLL